MIRRLSTASLVALITACLGACTESRASDTTPVAASVPPPTDSVPANGGFIARSVTIDGDVFKYQVFVPRGYDAHRKWPVLLVINGSGSRGRDNVKQVEGGLGPFVRARQATFPALVVFPQMPMVPEGKGTMLPFAIANATLDQTIREFNADPRRLYLSGVSSGSLIAFHMAYQSPRRFAGLVPIAMYICVVCISGDRHSDPVAAFNTVARAIPKLPIWAFHGKDDASFPVTSARQIVQAFRAVGSPIKYTEMDGSHAIWDQAYATPGLFEWLFAQHLAE